jgi:hypothetical protein
MNQAEHWRGIALWWVCSSQQLATTGRESEASGRGIPAEEVSQRHQAGVDQQVLSMSSCVSLATRRCIMMKLRQDASLQVCWREAVLAGPGLRPRR